MTSYITFTATNDYNARIRNDISAMLDREIHYAVEAARAAGRDTKVTVLLWIGVSGLLSAWRIDIGDPRDTYALSGATVTVDAVFGPDSDAKHQAQELVRMIGEIVEFTFIAPRRA
jgi:hypothetical protein